MSEDKCLEIDLKYNIINFQQVVLLTDLILEYKLSYAEVERLVESELSQAAKQKYEKTYLVQGQAIDSKHDIYTIVVENELEAAVKKLQNAQSNLYSVELCGGSKSVPQPLKPLTYATIALKDATKDIAEQQQQPSTEIEQKVENKNVIEIKKKVSPEVKKAPIQKPLAEKGQIRKATSPKKVNDFFKKNASNKKTTPATTKITANQTIELFEEESEDEEKKDKIRNELIENPTTTTTTTTNDVHDDEEYEMSIKGSANKKRRRILDSEDEEEQPQAKQDKKIVEQKQQQQTKEADIEPGTYMDEEGFVLTVKPKKPNVSSTPIRSSPRKAAVKPSPIKRTPKKKTPQKKAAPKTKQGSIMSFFGKK